MVHDGPKKDLGDGMTIDDLENLWPWLRKKGVPIHSDVRYERITDQGTGDHARKTESRSRSKWITSSPLRILCPTRSCLRS